MVYCALNVISVIDVEKLHKLRGKYQIPNDVHTRLLAIGERCCTPNSLGLGVQEAYLLCSLRFPLNAFAREVLHRLCIAPNQLNPNG